MTWLFNHKKSIYLKILISVQEGNYVGFCCGSHNSIYNFNSNWSLTLQCFVIIDINSIIRIRITPVHGGKGGWDK